MIGMVLAAGAGKRLAPLTNALPKTLLRVSGDDTILDIALANFGRVGLREAVIVTGFAAERIEERVPELERRHGLRLELVFNSKAEIWNNAYSLWCARRFFVEGVLLANGDTVHPAEIEERLLARRGADILLATDQERPLDAEAMKVKVSSRGELQTITKQMDPADAQGEYIGLTLIEPSASELLATSLEATWRRDPSLYYEDGFQEFVDRGGAAGVVPIGAVEWVEVDDHADLAQARELACPS